jgi:hypothetical protein
MEVEKQYTDSHGQSEVAFAFCRLLGFELLPNSWPSPRNGLIAVIEFITRIVFGLMHLLSLPRYLAASPAYGFLYSYV